MLFSSNVFLFLFLPAVLAVYYVSPRRFRNPVLLIFSLFFYGWGEPVYLFLMLFVIVLDYLCGLWIASGKGRQTALTAGIVSNLLILGYFKYAGLFFGDLLPAVPLPIGISFYIFQSMSYLIDLYRGQTGVQRSVLTFGTYVTLFPQLIAGPIVRYRDVADQLTGRRETLDRFQSGTERFLVGLCKKMLLANPMGSAWNLLQGQQGFAAWLGLLCCSLQIYFDFSGYSDMAIGLGRMFGFEFSENFNYPYLSASITEFWRRWHISLSTWFREYVYIPLGGNRLGLPRQIGNMVIVWLLTGLWHGASWNFVLWGGYYALLLILEKSFLLSFLQKLPKAVGRIYAMLCVMLGWALFFFEDLSLLGDFLRRLFRFGASDLTAFSGILPLTALAVFACTPVMSRFAAKHRKKRVMRILLFAAAVCGLLLCVAALARQSYNPFIYFRF